MHCKVHRERPAEYVCPACHNRPLCEACKQDHEIGTKHTPENCKQIGLTLMHQRMQNTGGMLATGLSKGLTKVVREFEARLLQEIDMFRSSCAQTEELRNMQKLDNEGRYVELYFYAKSLPASDAKSEAVMGELNKRLLKTLDAASDEFKNALSKIALATQYKPAFAAYKKDEVLTIEDDPLLGKGPMASLENADMSKVKAVYSNVFPGIVDCLASNLASCLQTHPVSALFLVGLGISDVGAEVLAQAAFRNKSLSAFCIWSAMISDTGAKAVAEVARGCRSLNTFYLHSCEISDSGAMAVAEAVKGCPLSMFCLAGDRISDFGAKAVAETVKGCPLSVFSLCGRDILDAGAISVAKTMKDYPLSAFYLGCHKMLDSGATTVAEILSSGGCASTLSAFCLSGIGISDSITRKVVDAVKNCPLLSAFCICGKPISGETVAYILERIADISNIRSVNLRIGEVSKEQIESCLNRLQQGGFARQLKLRFSCCTEGTNSMCKKFEAEWNAKFAEFKIVLSVTKLFEDESMIGVPV